MQLLTMKLLELHILQSFPVSCLNRDDLNSPKTAIFGGVQRARVSSQCWKRQIRLACAELDSEKFRGQRSRQFIGEITARLREKEGDKAEALAQCISHYLGKLDPANPGKVKTIAYYSSDELDRFAKVVVALKVEEKEKLVAAMAQVDQAALAKDDDSEDTEEPDSPEAEPRAKKEKGEKKLSTKEFAKLVKGIFKPALKKEFKDTPLVRDAADIAVFGRMVAADHSLTIEGAGMFSHALSVHKVDNEIDFFTAVDDLNPADDSGSGHMGTTEFNAATYYRYAALNLSMLGDKDHLFAMTAEEQMEVVKAFIRATLLAVPKARQNSMNAGNYPAYVLGILKKKGQPVQLVNAFESPLRASDGFIAPAIRELLMHRRQVSGFIGQPEKTVLATGVSAAKADEKADAKGRQLPADAIPEHVDLDTFINRLTAHVV